MKKDKKGASGLAALAAIVIVMVIAAAFVVSLVDTAPGAGPSNQFRSPGGSEQNAYIAERMEFLQTVEIYSVSARLIWADRVGSCTVYAELKDVNSVYAPVVVSFQGTEYDDAGPETVTFRATTLSGAYETVMPGTYWLVLRAVCAHLNQADHWRWFHPGVGADYDPAVVEPMGPCVDDDLDDYWQDRECQSYDSAYLLEGRVFVPYGDPPPSDDVPSDDVDDLVDRISGDGREDHTWTLYLILSGAVVVALIVVVSVKL